MAKIRCNKDQLEKVCPKCKCLIPLSVRVCPMCGHEIEMQAKEMLENLR